MKRERGSKGREREKGNLWTLTGPVGQIELHQAAVGQQTAHSQVGGTAWYSHEQQRAKTTNGGRRVCLSRYRTAAIMGERKNSKCLNDKREFSEEGKFSTQRFNL